MNQLLASLYLVFFVFVSGYAEVPTVKMEPYRMVQLITDGEDLHCDGANLTRYPAYSIYTTDGKHVLDVPESFEKPHSFKILPGTYAVEFKLQGKTKKMFITVGSDSFQRFKL